MLVWVIESNLMWSSRLVQTITALGHEALVVKEVPSDGDADAAILNLSASGADALVAELRARGVFSIGHAGHKEKDLLELGRQAGCDAVATNSELTFKLDKLLERAQVK